MSVGGLNLLDIRLWCLGLILLTLNSPLIN